MQTPSIPSGKRIYAIGDVHGRLDLLEQLFTIIQRDNAERPSASVTILMLGDLIDRGPSSAELIARCKAMSEQSKRFIILKGNHEAMMVDALHGSFPALGLWLKQGGGAALVSWGVPQDLIELGPTEDLLIFARSVIPPEHVAWLSGLPLTHRLGNCLFVHAGLRPGVSLARQDPRDLLWIRGDFTDSTADLAFVVIHGHSVRQAAPELRFGRLGIDTGAYRTGRLTAVGLENNDLWTMTTDADIVTAEA